MTAAALVGNPTRDDAAGVPEPPPKLKTAGRKLWRSTVTAFVLEPHELALLKEACRCVDVLDALKAVLDSEAVLDDSPMAGGHILR